MSASQSLAFPAPSPKTEKPVPGERLPAPDAALPPVAFDADYPGESTLTIIRKLRVPRLKKISKSLF